MEGDGAPEVMLAASSSSYSGGGREKESAIWRG